MCAKSLQSCLTLCDPIECSPPGSSVHGFSRQEYWRGLPCPPPGNLPSPGINLHLLTFPALQTDSLPLVPPEKLRVFLGQIQRVRWTSPLKSIWKKILSHTQLCYWQNAVPCISWTKESISKPRGPHAWKAAAKRSYPTSKVRGSGWECQTATAAQEQPRGATQSPRSGWWPRGDTQHLRSGAVMRGVTPHPRSGAVGGRSYTTPEARGSGTGGPRGAIPRWRSGRVVVRRYPSSKVRSIGCTLLEQPWRDTLQPR